MKCFAHNSIDAVAVCSTCHKGLCLDCSVQEARIVYCSLCAQEARATRNSSARVLDTVSKLSKPHAYSFFIASIIMAIMGIGISAGGMAMVLTSDIGIWGVILGVLFTVLGLLTVCFAAALFAGGKSLRRVGATLPPNKE